MRKKSLAADEHYKDHLKGFKPGTKVRYYKRVKNIIFAKERGGTLSEPTRIAGKHMYEYNGDKHTRVGPVLVQGTGPSFNIERTHTQK